MVSLGNLKNVDSYKDLYICRYGFCDYSARFASRKGLNQN